MKVRLATAVVNVVTAGTAVPLSSATKWVFGLRLKAAAGNAGLCYYGDSTVDAASGVEIAAGAAVEFKDVLGAIQDGEGVRDLVKVDLADIYLDAANNDEDVAISYFEEIR